MAALVLVWPGAIAIGLSLGLLGSGASILTVPVLVYLLGSIDMDAIVWVSLLGILLQSAPALV